VRALIRKFKVNVDGQERYGFKPEEYIYQKGSSLVVNLPFQKLQPNMLSPRKIEIGSDYIKTDMLPVSYLGEDLIDYWRELEGRGLPLSEIAHGIVTLQRLGLFQNIAQGRGILYPAMPSWVPLLELLSLLNYFEEECPYECNVLTKISELKKKTEPARRTRWMYLFRHNLPAYLKSVQNVVNEITSILSELRFAKILADEDVDFKFVRKNGDILIKKTEQIVDVTKRTGNLLSWVRQIEEKRLVRIGLGDVIRSCKRIIKDRAVEKGLFNGRIDILAVDITHHQLGTSLWAFHVFGETDLSPDLWLPEILESRKQVIFFSYVCDEGFYTLPMNLKVNN
jgi:hypothetical protein